MIAPVLDPQQELAALRQWIAEHCHDGEPIRQTAYGLSISAIVHRLIKYGPDRGLDHLSARDCLCLLLYLNGPYAEWVMRAAFTRALIEGDQEVVDRLAATPFMPEVRVWYHMVVSALLGHAPPEHEAWVDAQPEEPKTIIRLMTARLYPDTATLSWLQEAPDHPQLQAALAAVLLIAKPAYHQAIEAYLRERPVVRNYLL